MFRWEHYPENSAHPEYWNAFYLHTPIGQIVDRKGWFRMVMYNNYQYNNYQYKTFHTLTEAKKQLEVEAVAMRLEGLI